MFSRLSTRASAVSVLFAVVGCSQHPADVRAADPAANLRSPYADRLLYTAPDSEAANQADEWRTSDPDGAAIMDDLATVPLSLWLGEWSGDVQDEVDDALDAAGDRMRSFVVYNIPDRDCGNFSSGGADEAWEYGNFIDGIADGLAGREAIIILEPDGLALDDCLDDDAREERHEMLSDAVDTLTAAGGDVYIDAGDSNWIPSDDMAERLQSAGVDRAAGFALNVSHTEFGYDEAEYAEEIRDIIGDDAHWVIDSGRNGLGPNDANEWCNPQGVANGRRPTLNPPRPGLDARLWIKKPGHSDGYCNGGPEAGDWWASYARDLHELSPFSPIDL
jgi:endoglucanase